MSDPADAILQRLLGGAQLAGLRKQLRKSFARTPLGQELERIRIGGLSADEHAMLASLTGRKQRFSKSLSIDVRRFDADLHRAGLANTLREALEKLDGPILHVAESRLRLQTAWASVIELCRQPGLRGLLMTPDGISVLKRLAHQDAAEAKELCRRAEAVLRCLPAQATPRSRLAANVLGDPHALDNGRATATLVLAAWRQMEPCDADDAHADLGGGTERVRDIWARAGVLVNELARPALFLNLPAGIGGTNGRPGEPAYASLRSLLRLPPQWNVVGRDVYVCENPNLVAIAADSLGAGCAPLLCTDGMPAAAQRCILSQLSQAGARLRYHGDFDWPGLRIANHVMREHGATAWRFGTADYVAAARVAPSPIHALAGKPVEAAWDATLAGAMLEHGVAVAEEAVADLLLRDLDAR